MKFLQFYIGAIFFLSILWSKRVLDEGMLLLLLLFLFFWSFSLSLSPSLVSFPFSLLPSLSLSLFFFNDWRAQCFATSCTKAAINSRSLHSPLCFLRDHHFVKGVASRRTPHWKEKQHSSAWLPDTYCLSSALIFLSLKVALASVICFSLFHLIHLVWESSYPEK